MRTDYQYSTIQEQWFTYHPGGEAIHRWTTKVPGRATLAVLVLSLTATVIARRGGLLVFVGLVVVHLLT